MIIIVYNNLYKKRKCWSLSASLTYFVLNKSMKLISVLKFNWSMNKLQQQLQRSASGCMFNIKWNIEVMSCYEWIKIRWHPISFVCLYFKINEFGKFFYKLKIISFYSPLSCWRLCVVKLLLLALFLFVFFLNNRLTLNTLVKLNVVDSHMAIMRRTLGYRLNYWTIWEHEYQGEWCVILLNTCRDR